MDKIEFRFYEVTYHESCFVHRKTIIHFDPECFPHMIWSIVWNIHNASFTEWTQHYIQYAVLFLGPTKIMWVNRFIL